MKEKNASNPPDQVAGSSPARAKARSSQGGRRPTGEERAVVTPLPRRWSARRKVEVVLRLLRGETLDALSREIGQPASKISEWRENFLSGGEESMKARLDDPEHAAWESERRRLKEKIGGQAMQIELLYERCHKLEAGLPPARRRSRR